MPDRRRAVASIAPMKDSWGERLQDQKVEIPQEKCRSPTPPYRQARKKKTVSVYTKNNAELGYIVLEKFGCPFY